MGTKGTGDRGELQDPRVLGLRPACFKAKDHSFWPRFSNYLLLSPSSGMLLPSKILKNFPMRLSSLGIITVMLTCISVANLHVPFVWPALPPWKVVSSPRESKRGLLGRDVTKR